MGDSIQFLDFSQDPRALRRGSKEWDLLCQEVRRACELHGCFRFAYDGVPTQLREEMFGAIKALFDLPVKTKMKNTSSNPFYGYVGSVHVHPLHESSSIEGADVEMAQAFTNLMWPDGHPQFCKTIHSMSTGMAELSMIIRRMIFDSYGAVERQGEEKDCDLLFRMMKYGAPMSNDLALGLVPHVDKTWVTVLCQDGGVQGLQVMPKDKEGSDNWMDVPLSGGCFVAFIGEAFKAWSNGRLHAVHHRVMLSGERERFSCGLFPIPKEGVMIEVPPQLVDQEHPLIFRPFNYQDYIRFLFSNMNEIYKNNALERFAGV